MVNSNRIFVAKLSDRKTLTSLTKLYGENVYYVAVHFSFFFASDSLPNITTKNKNKGKTKIN